jgi:imidazolonepropionase-like amidohydrolase
MLHFISQPDDPADAADDVETNIRRGADLLKLFTGSYVERGRVLPMPVPIAKAAADVAHRHGQLVFSHPSDLAGTRVALESGVDVLAHAPDVTDGVDDALLAELVAKKMAMVPTLKMFATTVTKEPSYIDPIHALVRRFHALGGEILFGTDVGYMTDYSTEEEVAALADCGLSPRDVLRALTTAPAARFGVLGERGTVEPGKVADLVVLDADPEADASTFARPRFTIRGGKVIFERAAPR